MKLLAIITLFTWSISLHAKNSVSELSKQIKLKLDGKEQSYTISKLDSYNAYYRADSYDDYDNVVKISFNYRDDMAVELLTYERVFIFEYTGSVNTEESQIGYSAEILKTNRRYEINDFEYFSSYTAANQHEKSILEFTQLFATEYFDRVDAKGKYVSPIEYNPCDGCEHGDQFMISTKFATINVINMDFGDFYTPTCDEELHPWLQQIFSLNVPFMYYGTINAAVSDLWEGHGDHWMAAEGILSIGSKKENKVSRFLESMIFRAAQASGEDPLAVWDKIIEKGQFVAYENGILTFEYLGTLIKTEI